MKKKLLTIALVIIAVVVVFSIIFALIFSFSKKIVPGVSVANVDLSGLTIEEAREKLNNWYNENYPEEVEIKHGDFSEKVERDSLEPDFNANKLAEEAYKIGRDSNIIANNYRILNAILFKENIDYEVKYNQAKLESVYKKIDAKYGNKESYDDVLGEFETEFNSGNTNRATNIKLASSKLNEQIVLPGETFSYNETVGERTIAEGYKEALVYVGGEVANGVGGGICQVSTTLYNAVLLANLEIVERSNHSFKVHYVEPGMDATVSWGGPDLVFKNNRSHPIKIVTENPAGHLKIKIMGLKEDDEPTVKITSKVIEVIPYSTSNSEDSSVPKGTIYIDQEGEDGAVSQTTKTVIKNGEIVSQDIISEDTYNPLSKVTRTGTGEDTFTDEYHKLRNEIIKNYNYTNDY